MRKQDAITIELLSQSRADKLMKDLQKADGEAFNGFLISFDDEKKIMSDAVNERGGHKRLSWALPSDKRAYYLVRYEGKPYLLVGMHSYDTITSVAKMTSSLSGKGGECLRKLIEKELVYKCYAGVIYMDFSEDCDPRIHKLLLKLKENLPEGIENIYVYQNTASIVCKAKSSTAWEEKSA
jgi:hypothetical protein